jgi:hypothetical protein
VEDARPLAAATKVLEHRAREEREAEPVVLVGAVGIAVDLRTLEERRVFDEHRLEPRPLLAHVEAGAARKCVHGDVQRAREAPGRKRDVPVARHERGDAMAQLDERLRQRARDVAQAAGLGVRRELGGGERDVERLGHFQMLRSRPCRAASASIS